MRVTSTVLGALPILSAVSALSLPVNLDARYQICGSSGYDLGKPCYYRTFLCQTLASCSASCHSDSKCLSYSYGSGSCQFFASAVTGNLKADSTSPYMFYDVGCSVPGYTTAMVYSSAAPASSSVPSYPSSSAKASSSAVAYSSVKASASASASVAPINTAKSTTMSTYGSSATPSSSAQASSTKSSSMTTSASSSKASITSSAATSKSSSSVKSSSSTKSSSSSKSSSSIKSSATSSSSSKASSTSATKTSASSTKSTASPTPTPGKYKCPEADTAGFPVGPKPDYQFQVDAYTFECSFSEEGEDPGDYYCTYLESNGNLQKDWDGDLCPTQAPTA